MALVFSAGSQEETGEALSKAEIQVLLLRRHGARLSLPRVNPEKQVSCGALQVASLKLATVVFNRLLVQGPGSLYLPLPRSRPTPP